MSPDGHWSRFLKVFFQGDAKECRVRVQALNERCQQIKNVQDDRKLDLIEAREEQEYQQQQQGYCDPYQQEEQASYERQAYGYANGAVQDYGQMNPPAMKKSRWAKYLDENDEPF